MSSVWGTYLVVIFCILNNINKFLGCLDFTLFGKYT